MLKWSRRALTGSELLFALSITTLEVTRSLLTLKLPMPVVMILRVSLKL